MGRLTFILDGTLDGCVDHREGIADDETHAFFTRLMDANGARPRGRATHELKESDWPALAQGDVDATPAHHTHHLAGDLHVEVQRLDDVVP